MLGWQDYALCAAGDLNKLPKSLSPTLHLGILGINGLSAYVALVTIADVQPKETVLISTAAGAVGSAAVQIAKLKGCRVVGLAGTDEKCRWVKEELGADACLNYNKVRNMNQALKESCPEGIDAYLDNVGGETLAAVLNRMNNNGRIAMCGSIQSYNQGTAAPLTNYP
jgi:NADPH-dependent curcumin reductase CurA